MRRPWGRASLGNKSRERASSTAFWDFPAPFYFVSRDPASAGGRYEEFYLPPPRFRAVFV